MESCLLSLTSLVAICVQVAHFIFVDTFATSETSLYLILLVNLLFVLAAALMGSISTESLCMPRHLLLPTRFIEIQLTL